MKILIIEDDTAISKLYSVELMTKGYTVEICSNGEEGYTKALTYLPDLILCDIMMPVLNGIETLKKIRANETTKNIPMLMLTNFGQENLVKEAFNNGATDYILKYQSTPAEVTEKVKQHVTS
ncbi:MAG: response regulator [Patescibacteria group bacterium]